MSMTIGGTPRVRRQRPAKASPPPEKISKEEAKKRAKKKPVELFDIGRLQ